MILFLKCQKKLTILIILPPKNVFFAGRSRKQKKKQTKKFPTIKKYLCVFFGYLHLPPCLPVGHFSLSRPVKNCFLCMIFIPAAGGMKEWRKKAMMMMMMSRTYLELLMAKC